MGDGLKKVAKACGGLTVSAHGETVRCDGEGRRVDIHKTFADLKSGDEIIIGFEGDNGTLATVDEIDLVDGVIVVGGSLFDLSGRSIERGSRVRSCIVLTMPTEENREGAERNMMIDEMYELNYHRDGWSTEKLRRVYAAMKSEDVMP